MASALFPELRKALSEGSYDGQCGRPTTGDPEFEANYEIRVTDKNAAGARRSLVAFEPEGQPVKVALIGDTCLLIYEEIAAHEYIRLVDQGGLGPFATYRYLKAGFEG